MISFIKNNKLFSLMILITLITFFSGIVCSSILDNETRKYISKNISNIILNIKDRSIPTFSNYFKCFSNNSLYALSIWLFGISIVGLPIVIFLYLLKVFLFSIEFIYLFINIKQSNLLFIFIYLFPDIINILILFILAYYSVSYSIFLFRVLFLKKSYSLHRITTKYLKVYLFCLLIFIITSLLEILVIPKILYYII